VEVQGEEHLWSHRPAVFIFNHQSQLDLVLSGYLLRHGYTGVAKQELKRDPLVGLPFRFAGVAFVDRKGGKDPRKALAPAVAKLREGISIAIAPEGTRSLTPTLGPFKTGAFYLAREAGVPIVPIVIRNAGELMWRDSYTLKPGTVQVVVKPPIDVSQWPSAEMRERVAEVRQMYADTIARWPQGPATIDGVAVEARTPAEVDAANLEGEELEPKPLETRPSRPSAKRSSTPAVPSAEAASAKKSTAKKSTAKKSAAKKSAAKKSAAKKSTAKKAAAKKSVPKKSAAKKAVPRKSTARKTAAKKATDKRSPSGSLAIAPRTAPSGTKRSRERHSIVELVSPETQGAS
jgi:putative phosphoserine phosphatase / 1-acylglycerol-3-phosphate O-acyltransferase